MTESDWIRCSRLEVMLRFLLGTDAPRIEEVTEFPECRASDRKLRLFACACYHRIRYLLPSTLARAVVDVVERFADGAATAEDLRRCDACLLGILHAIEERWRASRGAERAALRPTHDALALVCQLTRPEAPKAANYGCSNAQYAFAALSNPEVPFDRDRLTRSQMAEERAQTDLLRCLLGPLPFRAVPIEPRWRPPAVVALARAIYELRCWEDLPVLADALEEAGCQDDDLLSHCRGPGPHARGCWAVDLILRKE